MKLKTKKQKSGNGAEEASAAENSSQPEGNLRYVPLQLLVNHDDVPNRKIKPDHVADLKASIEKNGLDAPIPVWNGGDETNQMEIPGIKGTYPATFPYAGFHCREALKEIAKEKPGVFKNYFPDGIPVLIRGGELPEILAAQLRENVDRDDPDPSEILPQLQRLVSDEFKMKPSEVAKAIGKSKTWVSRVLDIQSQLGKGVMEDVKSKKIKLSHAVEAAAEVKRGKRTGKKVSVKKVVAGVRAKVEDMKKRGRKRAEKRFSALTLYTRYHAMPNIPAPKRVGIAEAALGYLAGKTDDLPKELQSEE